MRILILTQYYPPEMGAPQARLHELATKLQHRGHAVSVLTGMPNYPTGRVFAGYRWKLRCTETVDEIRVIRTCLYPSKSSRTLPRLLSYLSFSLSCVLFGVWGLGRHDIVLVESPPLFLTPSGYLISRLVGARSIMMVSDIWPDIIVRIRHRTGGLSLWAMQRLEKWAYQHYDVVALTNPGAANQINERFPGIRTTVISNGVDTSLFRPDLRSRDVRTRLGAGPETFLVGYCGLHGLAQGLDVVIDAASQLKDHACVRFVMIGDGPRKDDLINAARAKNLENIRFLDKLPKNRMPEVLASCDAMLVPLVTELPGTMPSKVYEALAAGTPPIVTKGCEADLLVQRHSAGLVFPALDGAALSQAILTLADDPQLLENMRRSCSQLASRFDRGVIAERTEGVLTAIQENDSLPAIAW